MPAFFAPRLVMAFGGAMIILSIWAGLDQTATAWLKYGGAGLLLAGLIWRLLAARSGG